MWYSADIIKSLFFLQQKNQHQVTNSHYGLLFVKRKMDFHAWILHRRKLKKEEEEENTTH